MRCSFNREWGTLAVVLLASASWAQGNLPGPSRGYRAEVLRGQGAFARKLAGLEPPKGKGWKPVRDRQGRVELLIPEKWKVKQGGDEEWDLVATPPGGDREVTGALVLHVRAPADDEPLEVDEDFAATYAEAQGENPAFKKLDYRVVDSGLVVLNGQRFALAGCTMKEMPSKKRSEVVRKVQLVYYSEDRVTTVQFMALAKHFDRLADEAAGILVSVQNLGVPTLP